MPYSLSKYSVRPQESNFKTCQRKSEKVEVFKLTETAKTTISNRSRKLFTLSGIYQATNKLLDKNKDSDVSDEEAELAISFWNTVAEQIRIGTRPKAEKYHPTNYAMISFMLMELHFRQLQITDLIL